MLSRHGAEDVVEVYLPVAAANRGASRTVQTNQRGRLIHTKRLDAWPEAPKKAASWGGVFPPSNERFMNAI